MTRPDPTRLRSPKTGAEWLAYVTAALSRLEARIVARRHVGSIVVWPLPTAPNWGVRCNGQVLDRATYADLFGWYGTTFNTGGETTSQFRVPNITEPTPLNDTGMWVVVT